MNQDELKALVGQAALQYVVPGQIVGVGTGSTVNKFIEALASMKDQIKGAVSSSEASTARLKALGIPVFDSNEVAELAVYIDGADEINGQGHMVKGGGAALTREKIVAAQSKVFVCLHCRRIQIGFSAGRFSFACGGHPHVQRSHHGAVCKHGRASPSAHEGRTGIGHRQWTAHHGCEGPANH